MDVKQFATDNWPVLVGGAVGVFILLKMRGGSSTSAAPVYLSGGQSDAAIMANAQAEATRAQAALMNRELDIQLSKQNAELALQRDALEIQAKQNVEAARAANLNAAGTFLQAQSAGAAASGVAVAQMIGQLQAPAVAAIESSWQENAMALQSAALVAAGSFQGQTIAIAGITDTLNKFIDIPVAGMQGLIAQGNAPAQKSLGSQIVGTAGNLAGSLIQKGFF